MEMIKYMAILFAAILILDDGYSQNSHPIPLFNDTLPVDEILHKKHEPYTISESPIATAPRSFDADDLFVKDGEGHVIKDLTKSPCWQEIGYNSNMPRQAILDEYDSCEWEKKKSHIITGVCVILVLGFLIIIIRSNFPRKSAQ